MDQTPAQLEMALAEAVHRARNDLQAVVSMLRLQASATTEPAVREALRDTEHRVLALSALNTRLDTKGDAKAGAIDGAEFLGSLAADLQAMHFDHRPIKLVIDAASHPIGIMQGKPLGLIMNELVVNALKYAFPGDRGGEVHIKFRQQGDEYVLEVSDNGVGIDPTAPAQGTGLGKRLVRALALQIGGRAEITPGKRGGTECITRWPAFVEQT